MTANLDYLKDHLGMTMEGQIALNVGYLQDSPNWIRLSEIATIFGYQLDYMCNILGFAFDLYYLLRSVAVKPREVFGDKSSEA